MIPRNVLNQNWFKHQFVVKEDDGLHDYLQEYEIVIKQRERKRLVFNHRSIQFSYRRSLVDHLRRCINKYHLSSYCLHLAIYLLDIIMDKIIVNPLQLYLMANTCLLLAAKCEEKKVIIPDPSDLNERAKCYYSKLQYKAAEVTTLEIFDWYLLIPTAVHFVQFYMIQVIDEYDLQHNNRGSKTLARQIKRKASQYLYEIVDDFHYIHNFPPSQQAAAIIFAARKTTGLRGWSQQLQRFTGYYKQQLQKPLDILYRNNNAYCCYCNYQW